MPIVLATATVACLLWAAIAFRRCTPVGLAVATVAVGYVVGYSFWHLRVGGVPVTIDRLLLAALVATVAAFAVQGRANWPKPLAVDWAVATLLGWITLSCFWNNVSSNADLPTSPYFRLIFAFWLPAFLYLAVRLAPLSIPTTTRVLAGLAALGCYLAVTACGEITQQWWAVFPRYISDPELGTHFGRARGPALNSVSMGNYLCVAFWAAWTLRSRVARGWQLVLLAAMGLIVLAVLLTFTRSVWIGLALSGFVVLVAECPPRLRWPVAGGALVAGGLAAVLAWSLVLNLDREDSGQVSQHSVQQRTAFAYVSWNMFCDNPLTGVGFGRFYDKKLPYLSDRSQSFELESIRGLHHHNTFLGLLTETGVVGLAAYVAMLAGWLAIGVRMAFRQGNSLQVQQMGRLLLAVLAVYLPSALFHDISLIFQDQWLAFLLAGLGVATAEQHAARPASANAQPSLQPLSPLPSLVPTP